MATKMFFFERKGTLIVLLLFLTIAHAQAPKRGGRGSQFLSPLGPGRGGGGRSSCGSIPFRDLNGQCTSIQDQTWGQARFAQFSYKPGSNSAVPTGNNLKSAREISNIIFEQSTNTVNSQGLNQLFVFFGQFLDHNLVATPQKDSESLEIDVPSADPNLRQKSLPFKRSVRGATGRGSAERQINTLTSAIDLVAVYGPNKQRNGAIIESSSARALAGKLKTSRDNLLPLNTDGFFNSPSRSSKFFLAGDHRVNEHPVLIAMHTLFVREHNRLVDVIRKKLPSLPAKDLYEYARTLNIAQYQKIVYEDFYPAIIGRNLPRYSGFSRRANPTVSDIFSGAAFRIGHTMVGNEIPRADSNRPLASIKTIDAFFRPASSFSSTELDNFIRGTARTRAQEVDSQVVDALRNFLFQKIREEDGFDLVSLNIQRGRDHALPTFNEIRQMFRIPKAKRFSDISSNRVTAKRLEDAYNGKINDVEAFPGLLAEDHVRGAGVGRTMAAVWNAEFIRLRDGDQFFYLNPGRFPADLLRDFPELVAELSPDRKNLFCDIIVRNTGISKNQLPSRNIFKS